YAFPMLSSELLHESMRHPELQLENASMKKLAKRMEKVESRYRKRFIPWVNTFSYKYPNLDAQPNNDATYTPPMKADIQPTEGEVEPGVYVMFSGTGSVK